MKKSATNGFLDRYLFLRSGTYVHRRSVADCYLYLTGGKKEFKESLRTKDPTAAAVRYADVHVKYEAIFAGLRNGKSFLSNRENDLVDYRKKAASLGLDYRSSEEQISLDDPADFQKRIEAWVSAGKPVDQKFNAIFGTLPNVTSLNDVLEHHLIHNRHLFLELNAREEAKKSHQSG